MIRLSIIIFILFFFSFNSGFTQDARSILRGVNEKFNTVNRYDADVNLKTNISFIKMLPVNAKVSYTKPYNLKIKSTGISILPRQGFDQMFRALADTSSYFAVYQGREPKTDLQMVNIIPLSDTTDLVLGRFWIDESKSLIRKSQITTKSNGTIESDYFFGTHEKYALPDSIRVTIDTKKFKIPKAIAADINNYNANAKPAKEEKKGTIIMRFKNYRIN